MTTTVPLTAQQTEQVLQQAQSAAQAIANSGTVPVASNQFIFFAAFDGTDNEYVKVDGDTDSTAIQQLYDQALSGGNHNQAVSYYAGLGTPGTLPGSDWFPPAVTAQSIQTAQDAYDNFALSAYNWLKANPGGSVTSMIAGFSRGCAAEAIFAQMLYENGLVFDGQVLIPPGTIGAVSAALAIDPVLTGESGNMDFPPGVQNLTVVRAENEYRSEFTAADYGVDNDTIIDVPGNHSDAGDAYDNGLGGIYLGAYTSFFQNAGLSILPVIPTRQFVSPSATPIVIHSEVALLPPYEISLYDPTNDLSVTRETTSYGTPVTIVGNATVFTDYDGDIVIGGNGYSTNINSASLVLLPRSSASIDGVGDSITVNDGATIDFNSSVIFLDDSITFTVNSKVIIDLPFAFRGTIYGFVSSDTLDLEGIGTATSATLGKNNVLTVTGASGGTITLQLDPTRNYAGEGFVTTPDGQGGTDIVIPSVETIATFKGTNGDEPDGSLIEDSSGDLFGSTSNGGANQDGTVFEIPMTANGYGALTTLVSFNNSLIGYGPTTGLVADSAGDLFGTTLGGGANNSGSVFEIAKTGNGYAITPTILASFNFGAASSTTGDSPEGGVITDGSGDLVGTTSGGGKFGDGAVFELVGSTGPLTLLASFNYTDGAYPYAGLTRDSSGDLFGTTYTGGTNGGGTVFEIAALGGGAYANTPITLVNFASGSRAGLITDSAGDLFGTTYSGGASGGGTVFEIAKTGNGYASTPTTLASLGGNLGYAPAARLIMDAAGDLFGTTSEGGPNGAGAVFELVKTATGYASTAEFVTASDNFAGGGYGGLSADSAGDLFATSGGGIGDGTVIEITDSGYQAACFLSGTSIATASGDIAVEQLAVGDLVVTAAGELKPIKWIGHRSMNCGKHPKPQDVWPVRVCACSFGEGRPQRDLWLSPEHAVFAEGVLIPIRHLINGATIIQEPRDAVTYWHVELERHDVILAEGLPCETYLDTGNRSMFANGAVMTLHPSFARTAEQAWASDACAPLVEDGATLTAVQEALAVRAQQIGRPVAATPSIEIEAAGQVSIVVPAGADIIRLVSRSDRSGGDLRRLGALVRGVRIDGASIALHDNRLGRGFHEVEVHGVQTVRWTNGSATLALGRGANDRMVEIDVAAVIVDTAAHRVA